MRPVFLTFSILAPMSATLVTGSCAASMITSPTRTPFCAAALCGSISITTTPDATLLSILNFVRTASSSTASFMPSWLCAAGGGVLVPPLSSALALTGLAAFSSSTRRPTAMRNVFGWPLRNTSTSTVFSICVCATALVSARTFLTSRPSNFNTTSPSFMPPFAAGPSGVTDSISAPVASLRPSASYMSSPTERILTPSQPRRASL